MIYINMEARTFQTGVNTHFIAKVASTVEEACNLVEVGFEYVTEINVTKIFRKRK